MDTLEAKIELQRMVKKDLFQLALNRGISNCLIGGRPCGFLFQYKGSNFCVSEILGKGCQVEKLEPSEPLCDEKETINSLLPFPPGMQTDLLTPRKKAVAFKVYHRDHFTRSTFFLGRIIERRRKERGDNLRALLSKAINQYSDHVRDPSTIFLLEQ